MVGKRLASWKIVEQTEFLLHCSSNCLRIIKVLYSEEIKINLDFMKRFVLVLAFITMSLLSAVVESSELEACLVTEHSVSAKLSFTEHHQNDCHKNNCHDSNCFGLAHFGHGFYYSALPYKFLPHITQSESLAFHYLNHQSFVILDEIFRPPSLS